MNASTHAQRPPSRRDFLMGKGGRTAAWGIDIGFAAQAAAVANGHQPEVSKPSQAPRRRETVPAAVIFDDRCYQANSASSMPSDATQESPISETCTSNADSSSGGDGSNDGGGSSGGDSDEGGGEEDDPDSPHEATGAFTGDWIGQHWWVIAIVAGIIAALFIFSFWPVARRHGFEHAIPHSAFAGGLLASIMVMILHPWYWHRRIAAGIIMAWLGTFALNGVAISLDATNLPIDSIRDLRVDFGPPSPIVHIAAPLLAFAVWRCGERDLAYRRAARLPKG